MDAPPPDETDLLRDAARAARRALTGPGRTAAEHAISGHLVELLARRPAGAVGWYLPTDGEVDLAPALAALRRSSWRPYLPVVGPERSMAFAPWEEAGALAPNRFGVDEPLIAASEHVSADRLDVVVVPCVVVDRRGHRLGFGAGYYDRALAALTAGGDPLVVGVAFGVQVVERVPARPWDVPVQVLVTEEGALATGA